MKNLALLLATVFFPSAFATYGVSPFPNSPAATELEGVFQYLAERPGVHLILKMEPEAGTRGFPQSEKVVQKIRALRFSTEDAEGRKKVASYFSRKDNLCAAITIRSLAELLKNFGSDFDAMAQKVFDSSPAEPGKPSLEELQTVTAYVEFFLLGGGPLGPNANAAQRLVMTGIGPDGNPVGDDFDFAQVAYEYPVRKLHYSVPIWMQSEAGPYSKQSIGTETVNDRVDIQQMGEFWVNHVCETAGSIIPVLYLKQSGRMRLNWPNY